MSLSTPIRLPGGSQGVPKPGHSIDGEVTQLAHRSGELSCKLYDIKGKCEHESTSEDISDMAGELAVLGSILWRLTEHMIWEPLRYSEVFWQDLGEITHELQLICDEIDECCEAMQKADSPTNLVPWFFKKGRVAKLNKYMETLKTSLVVMRTVLWESTEGGRDENLQPGRTFLDAAVSRNRNAINELYRLDEANAVLTRAPSVSTKRRSREQTRLPQTTAGGMVGATSSTSPLGQSFSIANTIPRAYEPESEPAYVAAREEQSLNRRFTKRGVRLGVHASLLDMGAHDVENDLKQKWLQEAATSHRQRQNQPGASVGKPDSVISSISEIDPTFCPAFRSEATRSVQTRHDEVDENASNAVRTESSQSKSKAHSLSIAASPIGQKIKNTIQKLSAVHLNPYRRSETADTVDTVNTGNNKALDTQKNKENAFGQEVASELSLMGRLKKSIARKFEVKARSPLRTPDFYDTENMQSGLGS